MKLSNFANFLYIKKIFNIWKTTPNAIRYDDMYLVAFPKSGVTWLSFLMANLSLKLSNDPRKATMFNITDFVPDIHVSRRISSASLTKHPGIRIIKSHAGFNPYYHNIIYLVRNPLSVMESYYHFLTSLGQFDGTLTELIHDDYIGIKAWVDHIQGWFQSVKPSTRIAFLRYEDLRNNTIKEMESIMRLMGYPISMEILDTVVALSDFDNMKKDEMFYLKKNLTFPNNFALVRKGSSTVNCDFSNQDIEYIYDNSKTWMDLFGYKL